MDRRIAYFLLKKRPYLDFLAIFEKDLYSSDTLFSLIFDFLTHRDLI